MNKDLNLPKSLEKLEELSYNLWFSWNPDVRDLFRTIDEGLWGKSGRNPVQFLYKVDPLKIKKAADDPTFLGLLQKSYDRFKTYMESNDTAFAKNYPKMSDHMIAYFSAEYGIHESLPNYSGGLGVLAGDHTKSASDLGIPLVAVGLMYKHAYFDQQINEKGEQIELYPELDLARLPIRLVRDENNEPVLVRVPLLDREIYIKIWQVQIGRMKLFLLDTAVDKNSEEDQSIIHSLYGGSRDTRIRQEIILGIGGLRALRAMNLNPTIFHLNEGHSAFLGLERLFELMNEGKDFKTALEFVRATTCFTTHTPIPAGNEAFEFEMMERYFKNFWPELEISYEEFINLGRDRNVHEHEQFSLTILALNLSSMANGVSALHGEVSRKMWQKIWPAIPTVEVPIGHITNGIHSFTWFQREIIKFFDEFFSNDWRKQIRNEHYWEKIMDAPNETIWEMKRRMKNEMIRQLRFHYEERLARYGKDNAGYPGADQYLQPDILTIGFARRFAPYKRALLLFKDPERLKRIINSADRPVQFVFSGKAHPANQAGKDLITAVNEFSKQEGFKGKIFFVEEYNMHKARFLVSGVDVWLNNPRRPLEASGTSGQKVTINFGINFSVLDGWWIEGYNGQNGWAIGENRHIDDQEFQDQVDSNSMYELLENEVIPLYYNRDKNGIPAEWLHKAKQSFISSITEFSSHRMVWEYLQKYYIPMIRRGEKYMEEENQKLYQYMSWKNRVERYWKKVHVAFMNGHEVDVDTRILSAGESREVGVKIKAEGLKAKELLVELTLERHDASRAHKQMQVYEMGLVSENEENEYEYRANVTAENDGSYIINCRVMPVHEDLYNKHETRFIRWVD